MILKASRLLSSFVAGAMFAAVLAQTMNHSQIFGNTYMLFCVFLLSVAQFMVSLDAKV